MFIGAWWSWHAKRPRRQLSLHDEYIKKGQPYPGFSLFDFQTPPFLHIQENRTTMPPYPATAVSAGPHLLKRDLSVNHTQAVTLGVMAAYVVAIALLWNLPYVRWCLWPFKVSIRVPERSA